jgi:hypothetical protein
MTDAVRPINASVEAFRQARVREARSQRDDGALLELARLIGKKSTPSRYADQAPDAALIAQPKTESPSLISKKPAVLAPMISKRAEAQPFMAAYRTVSQTVKMEWNCEQENIQPSDHTAALGPAIDVMRVRSASNPHTYRSLPGAPPFSSAGLDTFDVGSRFDLAWPDRSHTSRRGTASQYMKVAASVGMIAAAIAGFWGGSVIKSGTRESIPASVAEPAETSAPQSAVGRPIRVVSTDANANSPFGSTPSAFVSNSQTAMARPLAEIMAATKSDTNGGAESGAASAGAVQPHAVPASAPSPIQNPASSEPEVAPLLPAAPRLTVADPVVTPSQAVASPAKAANHGPSHMIHQTEIARHSDPAPGKKRNPLTIIRFGSKNSYGAADPTGVRPSGTVSQSRPVEAQRGSNDSFLTRFFDKVFRN